MKRAIRYASEIVFAIVLIFVSYFAWDRIDVEAYEKYISQYTIEDVSVMLENGFNSLEYLSNEDNVNNSILSINNYQDRKYNANIILELDGASKDIVNNLILVVDNVYYKLDEKFSYSVDEKYYFIITNVNLVEYEKKTYNLKLLVNDNYEFTEEFELSYNFIEEII